ESGRASGTGRFGAEHVVAAPALRVAQRLVRHRDFLEPLLRVRVAAVGVGMQLACQRAIRALDLVLCRTGGDAQELVVVGHRGQALSLRPSLSLTTATAAIACG